MRQAAYLVDRFCYHVHRDPAFRERVRADPVGVLDTTQLDPDYRDLLLAGDVAELYRRGAHPVLLLRLAVYHVFGLTPEIYSDRIRAAA